MNLIWIQKDSYAGSKIVVVGLPAVEAKFKNDDTNFDIYKHVIKQSKKVTKRGLRDWFNGESLKYLNKAYKIVKKW